MKSRSNSSNRDKYQIQSKIIYPSAFTLVKHPLGQTGASCSVISNDAIQGLLKLKTKKFKYHLPCFNENILMNWLRFCFCIGILQQDSDKTALGD